MKKNRVYNRVNWCALIAAVLVCLTLSSSCILSFLLAKYATTTEGKDTSRVAKLGAMITIDGTIFDENINLLPGSSSDESGGAVISLSGTPEVSVETIVNIEDCSDICLPKGSYHINYDNKTVEYSETTSESHQNYIDNYDLYIDLEEDYYPIKYSIYKLENDKWTLVEDENNISMSELKQWLKDTYTNEFEQGISLSSIGTYKIVWDWEDIDSNTSKDSFLIFYKSNDAIEWKDNIKPANLVTTEKLELAFQINQID